MWKIVSSTDGQHIGEVVNLPSLRGDLVFEDGDRVFLDQIKIHENTATLISANCIFTAVKV